MQLPTYEEGWIAAHSPEQLKIEVDSPTPISIAAREQSTGVAVVVVVTADESLDCVEPPHDTRKSDKTTTPKRKIFIPQICQICVDDVEFHYGT